MEGTNVKQWYSVDTQISEGKGLRGPTPPPVREGDGVWRVVHTGLWPFGAKVDDARVGLADGSGGKILSEQTVVYFRGVWLLAWAIVVFLVVRLLPRLRCWRQCT